MSPILKPYGLQLAEVAPSWSQVGPKLGPCWPKLTPSRVAANLDRKGPLGRFWTDLQNVQITTVPIPWSFFAVCSLRKCTPPGIPVWQICPVASTAKLPRLGTFGAGRFISNGPGSDQRPPQVSGPNALVSSSELPDDECSDNGDGSCALNALQLRGMSMSSDLSNSSEEGPGLPWCSKWY